MNIFYWSLHRSLILSLQVASVLNDYRLAFQTVERIYDVMTPLFGTDPTLAQGPFCSFSFFLPSSPARYVSCKKMLSFSLVMTGNCFAPILAICYQALDQARIGLSSSQWPISKNFFSTFFLLSCLRRDVDAFFCPFPSDEPDWRAFVLPVDYPLRSSEWYSKGSCCFSLVFNCCFVGVVFLVFLVVFFLFC